MCRVGSGGLRYAGGVDEAISGAPAWRAAEPGWRVGDVVSGAAWGTVGAMAMTGIRVITTELGLVEQTPPQAVSGSERAVFALWCGGPAQAAPRADRGCPLGLWRGRRRGIRRAAPRIAASSVDWADVWTSGVVGF